MGVKRISLPAFINGLSERKGCHSIKDNCQKLQFKQARKPGSYASQKQLPTHSLADGGEV